MLKIRAIVDSDLDKIAELHKQFYQGEFNLPNFQDKFLCTYVVEEDGEIISVGGIKNILEIITVTDKSKSVRSRKEALGYIHNASIYFAKQTGFDQIHAFVLDEGWEKHLRDIGFYSIPGNAIILEIDNG